MKVEQILHMNGGLGENSYANNSSLQGVVISKVKPTVEESAIEVYCTVFPECLRIADLGCSSGPNTLTVAAEIIDAVDAACQCLKLKPPAFQVFLNDLPGNDFNTVFQSLLPSFHERLQKEKRAKLGPCFVSATPGSFYGRLFPNNSMHFIHSSYSLHFLSQVPKGLVTESGEPLNKGSVYLSKTSPAEVFKAYFDQFEQDFSLFLRSRSDEIVPGGVMVLTTMGRIVNPNSIWEVIGRAINDMVSEGLIEETKMDHFNVPYYAPTSKEVKKVIEEEGSFCLQKLNVFEIVWDAGFGGKQVTNNIKARCDIDDDNDDGDDKYKRGQYVSNYMRAVAEPILIKQFGETVMDDLFRRFTNKATESMEKDNWPFVNLVISLTRKNN